jgi:HEAT repeat protein
MDKEISIKTMLLDLDPSVRRDACESIADGRKEQYIPDLIEVLRDVHPGVREAAINALTSIGGKVVAEAVAPMLRLDDAALRNVGIEILELLEADAFPIITALLDDSDDDVVKFAVDILANRKEERAVGDLSKLIKHKNPNVRASVVVCLGRIRASSTVSILLKALGDEEEWVRFSAIEGLGLMHDSRALVPLLKIIERDSGLTKEAAIEAVSKIATPAEAAEILVKLEPLVKKGRVMNVLSIVELVEKASTPGSNFKPGAEFKEDYFNFFCKFMDDPDKTARIKAIKGISLLKVPAGLEVVFKFANSLNEIDEDTEQLLVNTIVSIAGYGHFPLTLKRELERADKSLKIIVKALGEMRSVGAVPVLEGLIKKVSKHELREVVASLAAIGSPDSMAVLFQSLKSGDGHTRKISARALGSIAGLEAAGKLLEALKAETFRDVMEEITDVLAMIPSEGVKRGFSTLLSDKKDALREMGARGLGLIGDEESIQFLKIASSDLCPEVRKVSYKSMARIGIPETIDLIVNGLNDPSDDVRLSVLKALGGWSGERIKSALLRAMKDSNIWVRYHAVTLIGEMCESDTEDAVITALRRDEAPVKAAAAKALEKFGSSKAVSVLEEFINHPDHTVRGAVESALGALKC